MGVVKLSKSEITDYQKYSSMLAGNAAYDPVSLVLIETISVTSTQSSLTFSGIPSTFKHLELRMVWIGGVNGGIVQTTFNGDTGSNYSSHGMQSSGTSVISGANATASNINTNGYNVGSNTTLPLVTIVTILDYASSSKNKTLRSLWGISNSTSTNSEVGMWTGHWRNLSPITSITLGSGGANWASGSRVSLYGIRG